MKSILNNLNRWFLLGLSCVMMGCGDDENILPAQGAKIKRIKIIDGIHTLGIYDFYYDSTSGQLNKVVRDSISDILIIEKVSATEIRMRNFYDHSETYIRADVINNHVDGIYSVFLNQASPLYRFVFKNDNIDTIIERPVSYYPAGYFLYKDYNIVYDGTNYKSTMSHEDHYDINFQFSDSTTEQVRYSYSALINPGNLPFQKIMGNLREGIQTDEFMDPVFILQQMGYTPFKFNTNLIDTIFTNNMITALSYEFDENNRIISIKRKGVNYTRDEKTYISYY